jgi:hypothetical protein
MVRAMTISSKTSAARSGDGVGSDGNLTLLLGLWQ